MLRALVLLLLAANAFWWAATHGWLPAAWLPFPDPEAEREPQRLLQQIRPEAIVVLPATAAESSAVVPSPTACRQTAPLDDASRLAAAEALLRAAGIEPARWTRQPADAGTRLRVDGLSASDLESLRAAAALTADAPAFSACD